MQLAGIDGQPPALWRVPLFADGLEEALPERLRQRVDTVTTPESSSS
jgi:hypothetical protein